MLSDDAPGEAPSRAAAVGDVAGRLHPLTFLVAIQREVRWFALPVVGYLFFGARLDSFLVVPFVIGAASAVLKGVVRCFIFSYRLGESELVIRDGILSRTERNIPLERVQDVEIERGPLHRLLGLADVRVQTAGGGEEPEAAFSALGAGEAERLRAAVTERARRARLVADPNLQAPAAEVDDVEVIRTLGLRDVMTAGVTSSILGPLLASIGAALAFADEVLPESIDAGTWEAVASVARQAALTGSFWTTALYGALALLLLLVLAAAASAALAVARFYGFTLSRTGESLHKSYGLFTRRTSSLPRRRVQVLEVEEGPMRRAFGLAALRVDTAGGAGAEPGSDAGGRDVLLPVVRAAEVDALLPHVFADIEEAPVEWRRVSRRAVARAALRGAVPVIAATGAALWFQGLPIGFWPLALLPVVYAISVLSYRGLGYAASERYLWTRRGWLGRSTHIVPIRNIQVVVVRQSPLDRRHGLATLVVDTAGQAYTGGGPRIACLPLAEASELARRLGRLAARTRYR